MIDDISLEITPRQAEAVRIADRVVQRAERGVPTGRHMHAAEELPMIEACRLTRAGAGGRC